jgi:capsular polysaccharide biosynthesis protein
MAYVRHLRRYAWLTAVAAVALAIAVAASHVATKPRYAATSQLLVTPLPNEDEELLGLPVLLDSADPNRTGGTAAAILDSPATAADTAQQMGPGWDARRVMDMVEVQPEGQSDIVDVTAHAASPRVAAAVADRFARTAVRRRRALVQAAVARAISQLVNRTEPGLSSTATQTRISELDRISLAGDPTVTFSHAAVVSQTGNRRAVERVAALTLGAGLAIAAAFVLLRGRRA